jgi:uroporphyrinogen III methyltransferase/synthase
VSLAGKRVVVTRAAEEAAELEALLRERGAIPVRFPCIAFEDGPDLERIAARVREGVDLIVVSSPHAARRLMDLIGSTSIPFAAVGDATAALLPGEVIVPRKGAGAEALLVELAPRVRGKRVLVPRAERGTSALINGLTQAGAAVEALTLYRTVTPASGDTAALQSADALSFASGSAVRGFVQLAGAPAANRLAVAAIGAATAGEAQAAGIRIDAYGGEGLADLCDALALAVSSRKG